MKKQIFSLSCAVLLCSSLTMTGCQRTEPPVSAPSAASTSDGSTLGDIPPPTTVVLAVTDDSGHIVTDASGDIVTQIVTQLPTRIQTVTDAKGQVVTKADGAAVTEAVIPPLITVKTDPSGQLVTGTVPEQRVTTTAAVSTASSKTAAPPNGNTTVASPIKTAQPPATTAPTTSKKPTTTTTKKPTTTTTKAPTTTTKAPVSNKDPWKYPYDVDAIIRECKAEIARVGLVWDDTLVGLPVPVGGDTHWRGLPAGITDADVAKNGLDYYGLDSAGWDNPRSTSIYTRYPDEESLKDMIFNDDIPFYVENQKEYSLRRCRIWFEPDLEYPGDYWVYFLYR